MNTWNHVNGSMEARISMAPARWNQTHDDSLVNRAAGMRNVRNIMNAVKQHYCLNDKDMKLLFHDMTAYVDDVLIANNQRVIDIADYLIPMRHGLIECCAYGYEESNENQTHIHQY